MKVFLYDRVLPAFAMVCAASVFLAALLDAPQAPSSAVAAVTSASR